MRRLAAVPLLLAGILLAGLCSAQEKKPTEYVLAPDDTILVSVPGYDEFSQKITITRDGRIALPEVGAIDAAGKTSRQLEKDLQAKIEKVRNNVSVSVLVLETGSKRVQIIGPVKVSGAVVMRAGWKLLDLIAAAGGITGKANQISAKLLRAEKTYDLDFQTASAKPDSDANVSLAPGDLIILDEREPVQWFVTVIGEVSKKGVVPLTKDLTLPQLVNMAGPTELGDLSTAHILRGDKEIPINLESIAKAKPDEKVQNFKLENGDTVFVPMIKTKFSVIGAVGHPGTFPLPPGRPVTVLEAFNLAGGGPQSNMGGSNLVRMEGGKYKAIPVNLEVMVNKKADMTNNIPLKDGDILYVPQKGRGKFQIQDLLLPLEVFRYLIP